MALPRPLPAKTLRLGALVLVALAPISGQAADLKVEPKVPPGLPAGSAPSSADTVGNMINPQWRNANMPLPAANLAERGENASGNQRTQIYGRVQQGGQNGSVLEGLVGVRVPFPSAPATSGTDTTSGSAYSSADGVVRTR